MESGFLLIDKPAGITSHDVINRLRKITGIKKIGHAGTLDPFATGLLVVAVGREATREIDKFVGLDKTYEAEFVLGATTESLDTETPLQKVQTPSIPPEIIEAAMESFLGTIEQIPPKYSAIKKQGKKLYELARAGKEVELEGRPVAIHEFKLLAEPKNEDGLIILSVLISCSSGTYVRALARDLGEKLKTAGYVRQLKRTSIGPFFLENAQHLTDLSQENWTKQLMHVSLET